MLGNVSVFSMLVFVIPLIYSGTQHSLYDQVSAFSSFVSPDLSRPTSS